MKTQMKPSLLPLSIAMMSVISIQQAVASSNLLPRIDVIGSSLEDISKLPGSVAVLHKEDLEQMQPLSVQDALKTVPGVTVREEEGYGFIPNIGMRGLDPNRSQKLLVLEDGVPVAPSLFLANESYYSPRIERMESIEVLKGAAGLRYGPTTIGGVINYKTKQDIDGAEVTAKAGSHGYRLMGLDAGGIAKGGDQFGSVSLLTSNGDGLRHNGFDMQDVVIKGGMKINNAHTVGIKFTHYENDINTSYVGLRPNEYRTNPNKNSAPDDYFLTQRDSVDVNHQWNIGGGMQLNTLVYWSELSRDYWRRNVQARTVDGTVFKTCDGTQNCKDGNNRTFEMLGVDSRLGMAHNSFGIKNQAELGIRVHTETLDNKKFVTRDAAVTSGGVVSGTNALSKADSLALYAQNRFEISNNFAITPGLRVESYHQKLDNQINQTAGNADNVEVVPGVGATYSLTPKTQVFAGLYKGFSPAMVASAISSTGVDQQLDAERSTNAEIGLRGKEGKFNYEVTAFHMDFENQIVNQSEANGITKANGGKTLNQGVEASVGYLIGGGFRMDANATWLPTAKYNGASKGTELAPKGNRLQYAPELVTNVSFSYAQGKLRTSLGAYHVSEQFADAANTRLESMDGTKGLMDAYTVYHLNAQYAVNKQMSLFGVVRNLTDEKYIASRKPDGIFPGVERNFEVGVRYKF